MKTCYFSILNYLFNFIGSHTTLGHWQVGRIIVATGVVTHSHPLLLWSIKIQKQMIKIIATAIHQKLVPKAKHIYNNYPSYIVHPPYIISMYQKASNICKFIHHTMFMISIHCLSTIHQKSVVHPPYNKFMILTNHSWLHIEQPRKMEITDHLWLHIEEPWKMEMLFD
jgi:hypothetical protein